MCKIFLAFIAHHINLILDPPLIQLLLFHNEKPVRLLNFKMTIFVLFQVEREWNLGNYEAARTASRWAKNWFIITCFSGIILTLLFLGFIIALKLLV